LTTEYLPAVERNAGVRLGLLLVLYLAGIHAFRGRFSWALPKEIFVGVVFACGVTLSIWSRGGELRWHECVPWAFFALLCCLNCLAIENWENDGRRGAMSGGVIREVGHRFALWTSSPLWPSSRLWTTSRRGTRITVLAAALAGLTLVGFLTQGAGGALRYEWMAVCLGALLLLALNLCRRNLSPVTLRVLADVAVLLPAVLALAMQGWGA